LFLKAKSTALILDGFVYAFDDLLRASRPSFQQVNFRRSEKLRGSVTFCELNCHKEGLRTTSALQRSGIIYLLITKTYNGSETVLGALILKPTDGTAKQHKRIGIAEICPGDSMFAGWRRIEIV
jgi:hypothetical protein